MNKSGHITHMALFLKASIVKKIFGLFFEHFFLEAKAKL